MEIGAQVSIEILHNGKTGSFSAKSGMTLSEAMGNAGHPPGLPCGGKGICRQCVVRAYGAISPPSELEIKRFTRAELLEGLRLACQVRLAGGVTIVADTPEELGQILMDGDSCRRGLRPFYRGYGVAVDVGTTTLCARMCDPNGVVCSAARKNPQAAFGADVISRIEAALGGKGSELAESIRGAVSEMLAELAVKRGIRVSEIDGLVLTGNTTMLYLLTEHNPEPLSHAPFKADRLFGERIPAGMICDALDSSALVYLPRCMSAFVGADITTAVLASGMRVRNETSLLVDAGTNGEIALWHEGSLFCCSTAAGPAFEGGGITNGVYGLKGAIDKVWVENGELAYSTIGGLPPIGICGSGIVDAIAVMLETGRIDETGAFMSDSGMMKLGGVEINARDVRAVQLAKGAVRAGIETLLQSVGVDKGRVDKLYIAGGFGNYLDLRNAAAIGIVPPELLPSTVSIGNAALAGAQMLLQDEGLMEESEYAASQSETIALDANPVFMDNYMSYMMFE